jgi:AAA+ ATPase superfamily predicted ATPase
MEQLIGRKQELAILSGLKAIDVSAFVAIYGRRRVGKTFLVRKAFENQFTFHLTGMANVNLTQQLLNFSVALRKYDKSREGQPPARSWQEAFEQLIKWLEKSKDKKGLSPLMSFRGLILPNPDSSLLWSTSGMHGQAQEPILFWWYVVQRQPG